MPAASRQVTTNFLDSLRQATQLQHAKLEETKLSQNLLSDDVSLHDYFLYLVKMETVMHFFEEEIFPIVKDVIHDTDDRKKLLLLQNDLSKMPFNLQQPGAALPSFKNLSLPFALGCMYVIEGSTLGGRFIAKHIKNKLGIDAANGGSFFEGYGMQTGKAWKNFLDVLCNYADETQSGEEIINGAQYTFETIYNYFK